MQTIPKMLVNYEDIAAGKIGSVAGWERDR